MLHGSPLPVTSVLFQHSHTQCCSQVILLKNNVDFRVAEDMNGLKRMIKNITVSLQPEASEAAEYF